MTGKPFMPMPAKTTGRCTVCGNAYRVGDWVKRDRWTGRRGFLHAKTCEKVARTPKVTV